MSVCVRVFVNWLNVGLVDWCSLLDDGKFVVSGEFCRVVRKKTARSHLHLWHISTSWTMWQVHQLFTECGGCLSESRFSRYLPFACIALLFQFLFGFLFLVLFLFCFFFVHVLFLVIFWKWILVFFFFLFQQNWINT